MVWQLLAIWTIVIVTLIWFVRDEKRRVADAAMARAARYYAHAPRYRHAAPEPVVAPPAPPRRSGGLSDEQRRFLKALQR